MLKEMMTTRKTSTSNNIMNIHTYGHFSKLFYLDETQKMLQ